MKAGQSASPLGGMIFFVEFLPSEVAGTGECKLPLTPAEQAILSVPPTMPGDLVRIISILAAAADRLAYHESQRKKDGDILVPRLVMPGNH